MQDFDDPLDLLDDDGDGVIEISLLEEEEKRKKGGSNNKSGCCVLAAQFISDNCGMVCESYDMNESIIKANYV